MAPLPTITGVFRITLEWTLPESAKAANVFHIFATTDDETEVSTAVQANLDPDQFYGSSSSAHLTGVDVIALDGTSTTFHQTLDGSFTGLGGSDYIAQGATIVSFGTGLRGRSNRGRMFLPALAEDRQDGGIVAFGAVSTMQVAWDNWVDNMRAAFMIPVVASYRHHTAPEITTVTIRDRCGTIRHRNRG